MSLLEWEWWLAVNSSIEVTSELFLNHLSASNMLWLGVRKLYPVLHQVVGNPEHGLIHTLSSQFLNCICWLLLLHIQSSLGDPVIFICAEDLAEEFNGGASRHHCQSFD